VFWAGAGDAGLTIGVVAGLVVSVLLTLNIWPRRSALVATLLFLSCVSVLQDFSAYQSDGMLLEAGVIAVFLAPRGRRPGLGADDPPMRLAVFMLLWEWFRIYFESGVVKLASGDIEWRTLTALDHYYENNPLPTWIGWYVQELTPRIAEHVMCAGILAVELLVPWMMFLPRRGRLLCAAIVTPLQIGIILTANYAFLNYLVLLLGRGGAAAAVAGSLGGGGHDGGSLVRDGGGRAISLIGVRVAGAGAGAVPDREPVRPVRHDDDGALRDRVSGHAGRGDLGAVSLSLQAPDCGRGAGHLRPVSAEIRVEPVVCLARQLAGQCVGGGRAGPAAGQRSRRPGALSRESLSRHTACTGSDRALAILVHEPG
jgi:hypothetical protein